MRTSDGIDIRVADFGLMAEIVKNGTCLALVWKEEGQKVGDRWEFNQEHAGFEPLLFDLTTAGVLVSVHKVISDDKKEMLERLFKDNRGQAGRFVEMAYKAATGNLHVK